MWDTCRPNPKRKNDFFKKTPRTVKLYDSRILSLCMKLIVVGFCEIFIMVPSRPHPLPELPGMDRFRQEYLNFYLRAFAYDNCTLSFISHRYSMGILVFTFINKRWLNIFIYKTIIILNSFTIICALKRRIFRVVQTILEDRSVRTTYLFFATCSSIVLAYLSNRDLYSFFAFFISSTFISSFVKFLLAVNNPFACP